MFSDNSSRLKVLGILVVGILLWSAIMGGLSFWSKPAASQTVATTTATVGGPSNTPTNEEAHDELNQKINYNTALLEKLLAAMNLTAPIPPPPSSSSPSSKPTPSQQQEQQISDDERHAPLRTTCENNHFVERLLPMPKEYSSSNVGLPVAGPQWFTFTWDTAKSKETPEIVLRAFQRYSKLIFSDLTRYEYKPPTPDALTGVHLTVRQPVPPPSAPYKIPIPQYGVDESYSIVLAEGTHVAVIEAETIWGALRGLETFRQIVECWGGLCCARSSFKVNDKPRYGWRGVLVDTARHFITVPALKRVLDGLEAHKLNIFHWHIMDGQSFPLYVETYPEISKKGAYSQHAVYMPKDVSDLIEYAAERGISVMPEFDMPSHVSSWGKAFPEIVYDCLDSHNERPCGPHQYTWNRDGINGFCVNKQAFNPTSDKLYEIVGGVLSEFSKKFPSQFIHLGGDELLYHCWEKQEVKNWMAAHGVSGGVDGLLGYFSQKMASFVGNKTVVRWEEAVALTNSWKVPSSDIFHIWYGDGNRIRKALSSGYRIINSQVGGWYMDWVNLPQKWRESYNVNVDSIVPGDMRDKLNLLIGAESTVWAEMVDDDSLDSSLWPISSALSERMWSFAVPGLDPFRMELHICRLKAQGIRARVIGPGHCDPMTPF